MTTDPSTPQPQQPTEHIAQFFEWGHLRPELQAVSRPFGELAAHILTSLPRNPERTVALRKLLEAKDAAELVRAQRLANAEGPDRIEGTAHHQALDSFVAHVNRFKQPHSAVWANPAARELVAVLDYHEAVSASATAAKPHWGKHRAVYPCPLSEAWAAWGHVNGLVLSQDDFAALLDSRDRELIQGTFPGGTVAPAPSALISLANNLEVFSTCTARRERDPNTGRVKLSFTEEKGVAGGSVLPPPAFLIQIPVFQDSLPVPLEVRLRVTVEEGHARFHLGIHAALEVLRNSFAQVCATVQKGTGLPVFMGTPE